MSEEYNKEEKLLMSRFMLERTMHEWDAKDKIAYIALLNRRAGLPFGTIGLLRTESKKGNITEVPYASRQTTVELGKLNKINVEIRERDINDRFFMFVARATDLETGRFVEATGVCAATNQYGPLTGDFLSNKIMHAETKAKRRATLEVCGLAFLDESETESMEGAVAVNLEAPSNATTPAEAPKGNGKPPAPKSEATGAGTSTEAEKTVATKAATPTPKAAAQSTPPIATAAATPKPECDPVPARYEGNALFAGDDDSVLVGDKEHIDFIVSQGKGECGWDGQVLAKWLMDTFGVTNKNKGETLTLGVFKRIMAGIDAALTGAGR